LCWLGRAANDSNAAGNIDVESSRCLFSQGFETLKGANPESYRSSEKVYSVHYAGEAGIDAGGVWGSPS
jgi:hypothetical protein